jgi:prepilin-type N-terminal cleavage/methylation domain-containing protein
MTEPRKRTGFSLAEILVAIAIVAVVAAVVIPSIGGQLRSGDESRVQQDLTNLRSGIEQFLADVRRYPKSVGQLTNVPLAGDADEPGLTGGVYTVGQVGRWRGPYISKDSVEALKTGFDVSMNSAFTSVAYSGINFLTITITNFDNTNATRLDQKMDDGVLTTGQIQWVVATAPLGTLTYFVMPIQ